MIISYNWLSEYLPVTIDTERLSKILTSIGLEVESVQPYNAIKGGLAGIVVGQVLTCTKHPDADKLHITTVNIGTDELLQIVCGASNVAAGLKVLVATVGTILYPIKGEPLTIKKAKIRGVESVGMLCAEDEIGIGQSHDGIMILPNDAEVGSLANSLYENYTDYIFEIGLTPNRMDAMSHLGVARDVCAYLWHHDKTEMGALLPFKNNFKPDNNELPISVQIENTEACKRYAGVSISGITVGDSPIWLQNKLKAIGVKCINNIVDITNFILHETGQPLHAFDASKIVNNTIIVKNATEGQAFITLDAVERKLVATDVMIANSQANMCIAGVYGGADSGISHNTQQIFLESACFDSKTVRITSIKHGLRTDAATRFEKGVDISNTVNVLKRAAILIKEIAGGKISSDVVDIYPAPKEKTTVSLKYHYLKKLSGKNYHPDTIKNILTALGFDIQKEGIDEIWVNVPYYKTDIAIAADLVEEILRIDGLDNIEIPHTISIAPSASLDKNYYLTLIEKAANYLTHNGYSEIFTNSITNSKYYQPDVLNSSVKMLNNLSANLDIMRPSLLQTGLEVIAYNINRKNTNLKLYEFGKVYSKKSENEYIENNQLGIFVTGTTVSYGWQQKERPIDIYYIKGLCEALLATMGITNIDSVVIEADIEFDYGLTLKANNLTIVKIGVVAATVLKQFGIKEQVCYANIYWNEVTKIASAGKLTFKELSKYPFVQRDLAIIVDKNITYAEIEKNIKNTKIAALKEIKLFDVFESDKLGVGKKSMAINFTFSDDTKTLEDTDTETMISKIAHTLQKSLNASIRK